MYTLIDKQTLRVLYSGLSREDMRATVNDTMHFMEEDSYPTTPQVGMRLNDTLDDFVHLSPEEIRQTRNELLVETDWRATVDYPNLDQGAWLEYRQALRDIPQDYPEMVAVVFPTEPS